MLSDNQLSQCKISLSELSALKLNGYEVIYDDSQFYIVADFQRIAIYSFTFSKWNVGPLEFLNHLYKLRGILGDDRAF